MLRRAMMAGGSAPPPAGSTFDPSLKGASVVLSNANLDATKAAAGYQTVYGTQGRSSGRYAFEVLVTERPSISTILIGIADKTNSAGVIVTYLGNNGGPEQTLGYNDNNGSTTQSRLFRRMTVGNINGNGGIGGSASCYAAGDVITVDVDFAGNVCNMYENGVLRHGPIAITAATYFPAASLQSAAAVRLITTGLSHLPSGATAWG